VRRYLCSATAEVKTRRRARSLEDDGRSEARQLFEGAAEGNAVVVQQMLSERGVSRVGDRPGLRDLRIVGAPRVSLTRRRLR
jgi:hypothetical protein